MLAGVIKKVGKAAPRAVVDYLKNRYCRLNRMPLVRNFRRVYSYQSCKDPQTALRPTHQRAGDDADAAWLLSTAI
jgi:hypothetical protein